MKKEIPLKKRMTLLVLGLAAVSLPAQIISVNVGGSIDATRVLGEFGVPDYGTVAGGWNNIGFDKENLLWSDGSESTVGVLTSFPWGKEADGGGDIRFGAGSIGTPLHHGPIHYEGTPDDPGTNLTFYNLRDNFPDGFYLIAYVTGWASNQGALVTDGRTTFYYKTGDDGKAVITPEVLVEATDTMNPGAGNFMVGHYAVFGSKDFPKISDVYTIRIDTVDGKGVSIGGVQIVDVNHVTGPSDWAGYPIGDEGYVNTGSAFLGWLWVGNDGTGIGNWYYSVNAAQWLYTTENFLTGGSGGWIYLGDSSKLQPTDIRQNWYFSGALNTWVASFGETTGSGPAWIYALDLSQ